MQNPSTSLRIGILGGGQLGRFDAIPGLKARNLLAVVKLGLCASDRSAALQHYSVNDVLLSGFCSGGRARI